MKRNIEDLLIKWKGSKNRKPLLITGARQIGKTHTVKKFAKSNFSDFFYFNLESDLFIKNLFNKTINPSEIIKAIEIEKEIIIKEKSIIVFDEIQINNKAITSLKYFKEDRDDLFIIGTGSLLGVTLSGKDKDFSFPVGKVDILNMYPFTFDEFLDATNNTRLKEEIIKASNSIYENNITRFEFHEKAMKLYKDFLFIGGMPEVIKNYIDNSKEAHKIDKNILINISNGYIADMAKHVKSSIQSSKIQKIFQSLPSQLNKPSTKFQYSKLEKGARKKSYEGSVQWLLASNIVISSKKVRCIKKPLNSYETDDFKAFFSDTGILCSMSGISYKDIINDNLDDIKGALAENFVNLGLISLGFNNHYYKEVKPAMEIDNVIKTTHNGIIPIEVKYSTNIRSESLDKYIKKFSPSFAIRFSLKNFGRDDNLISLPLYSLFTLKNFD